MQDFLFNEFNIQTSIYTIRRVLEAAQWSRKIVSKRAAQQSIPLRTTWQGRQKQWLANQLVFLDKSASNKRTSDRKRGWSLRGIDYKVLIPYKRSKQWSILPALTLKGYISYLIFQGAFTSKLFKDFVEY